MVHECTDMVNCKSTDKKKPRNMHGPDNSHTARLNYDNSLLTVFEAAILPFSK
jgi:hypothetical protein